ncbi:hypothetical protein Hanom_Chr16g01450811 [Helianthus anomalus]
MAGGEFSGDASKKLVSLLCVLTGKGRCVPWLLKPELWRKRQTGDNCSNDGRWLATQHRRRRNQERDEIRLIMTTKMN